ncbi:MAG: hypothetical protein RKO66_03625, partial [Candidatus Contendobacter sp.]|nr:hypothetical protein [Candidatus Contendobacter sp.]
NLGAWTPSLEGGKSLRIRSTGYAHQKWLKSGLFERANHEIRRMPRKKTVGMKNPAPGSLIAKA